MVPAEPLESYYTINKPVHVYEGIRIYYWMVCLLEEGMENWEYKSVLVSTKPSGKYYIPDTEGRFNEIDPWLQDMASQDWELVKITPHMNLHFMTSQTFYFKRLVRLENQDPTDNSELLK